jgi:neutral ceramidase
MLRIGFSEVNITPEPGLRLAGMVNPPKAERTLWPLYGRTMVFDDGVKRAAVVTCDLLFMEPAVAAELRRSMAAGCDLEPTDIMIACTHTHRAPHSASLMNEPVDWDYVDLLGERLATGMRTATEHLRPARLRAGHVAAPGLSFNRRPIYRSDLCGEQVATHGTQHQPGFLRLEGEVDDRLSVLLAQDLAGAPLAGFVHFACHATAIGTEPVYASDYPGPLTATMLERHKAPFGFLQGCCGDICRSNTADKEPWRRSGPDYALTMGAALADKAGEALARAQAVDGETVRMERTVLRIPQRMVTREQAALARGYLTEAPKEIDQREFTRKLYGHDYTFWGNDPTVQRWFCHEAVGMWEHQRRSGTREIIEDVEVQAIAVGDVAFVGLPGEIFAEFGRTIREQSPFAHTFVLELANGWHGYVPTKEAFRHGGYEPRLAHSSRLAEDAGERMVAGALQLMKKIGVG